MKEIKAYVHANRIADVIRALKEEGRVGVHEASGPRNLSVQEVKGLLRPLDTQEQHYSMELAEAVIHEYRLELICDDDQVDALVGLIARNARTGQRTAGWICVTDLVSASPIGGSVG